MIIALTTGAQHPGFKLNTGFFNNSLLSLTVNWYLTLSVHPAVNGYLTLFGAGEGEGGEEEEWCPNVAGISRLSNSHFSSGH